MRMVVKEILKLSLRHGVVTLKYPRTPIEVDELYRGKPVIDPQLCVGCGACATACPPQAISVEDEGGEKVWRLFCGRCIFCARCQEVCPVGAITLSREFELASRSRNDLVSEVRLAQARCGVCGSWMGFTWREVELVKQVLRSSSLPREVSEELAKRLPTCPECRQRLLAKILAGERVERG